jgi:hypothetical protein
VNTAVTITAIIAAVVALNIIVTAMLDTAQTKHKASQSYPRDDGDVTALGPEVFASKDGAVICWRGENYIRQEPK